MCLSASFCTSKTQTRYKYGMFSGGHHCLGLNTRVWAQGRKLRATQGFFNKLRKGLGSHGGCDADDTYSGVHTSQINFVDFMARQRDEQKGCTLLEPLPSMLLPHDCLCCAAIIDFSQGYASQKDLILSQCLLGYRGLEFMDQKLNKTNCPLYCNSLSTGCPSVTRNRYAFGQYDKGHHCLAVNSRIGVDSGFFRTGIGNMYNKAAKSFGSYGLCQPSGVFDRAKVVMLKRIAKIDKELGKKVIKTGKGRTRTASRMNKTEDKCHDADNTGQCKAWANLGECEANVKYMKAKCSKSCAFCKSAAEVKRTSLGAKKPKGNLTYLTRYGNLFDDRSYPQVFSRLRKRSKRTDGITRFASPFEHVCGGARPDRDEKEGYDGPTQYISFSNAGDFEEVTADCQQPFDSGQRRVKVSAHSVEGNGGRVFDLSTKEAAWKWCWDGGCFKTEAGREICFKGAKEVKPWPFKCAQRAYQIQIRKFHAVPNATWWEEDGSRKLVAESCVTWATRAREVLVLPNPELALKGSTDNGVTVETDRKPVGRSCLLGLMDRCVDINVEENDITCCSDGTVLSSRCKIYNKR